MGGNLPRNVWKHHTRNISSHVGLGQETARVTRQEPAWLRRTSPASHGKHQKATFPASPEWEGVCTTARAAEQVTAPHHLRSTGTSDLAGVPQQLSSDSSCEMSWLFTSQHPLHLCCQHGWRPHRAAGANWAVQVTPAHPKKPQLQPL